MRSIFRSVKAQKLVHGTCTCIRTCMSASGTENITCLRAIRRLKNGAKKAPQPRHGTYMYVCACTLVVTEKEMLLAKNVLDTDCN